MKKVLFIALAGLTLSLSATAQKKKSTKGISVPEAVTTSFDGKFTDVEKKDWKKSYNGNYVVTFVNAEQQKQTAEFDKDGNMVRARTEFAVEALPEAVNASVASNYTDWKVTEVAKVEVAGIPSYYKVKIETADNTRKDILVSEEGAITE